MTAHVAGKYEKSWPGTGTYFDALHAHIMPYLSDYRRLPSVLARLKVIIDHEGGLEMSRAEWNEVKGTRDASRAPYRKRLANAKGMAPKPTERRAEGRTAGCCA